LLQLYPAVHQVLLYISGHQLDFEIAGVLLGDLVQTVKKRLQPRQIIDLLNLSV
jgi:hypothetical protein